MKRTLRTLFLTNSSYFYLSLSSTLETMDKLAIANGGHIMNGDSNSSPIHPHHNHHSHLHQHHPHQAGHETNLVLPPILPPLSSTLHGDANAPNGVSLPQIPAYYHGPHTQHDHHQVQEHQPLDAGAEQGLAALGDSPDGAKPFYPYSTLIRSVYFLIGFASVW